MVQTVEKISLVEKYSLTNIAKMFLSFVNPVNIVRKKWQVLSRTAIAKKETKTCVQKLNTTL